MNLGTIPGGVACATGHRPQHIPPVAHAWCASAFLRVASKLATSHGVTVARCGMAIGADMWWGHAALAAGMRLHADIPFLQQPDVWRHEHRTIWADLRRRATTEIIYGSLNGLEGHSRRRHAIHLLHTRNDGMLTAPPETGVVVALWNPAQTRGGTASAVTKAQRAGLPIIHINPAKMTINILGGA